MCNEITERKIFEFQIDGNAGPLVGSQKRVNNLEGSCNRVIL